MNAQDEGMIFDGRPIGHKRTLDAYPNGDVTVTDQETGEWVTLTESQVRELHGALGEVIQIIDRGRIRAALDLINEDVIELDHTGAVTRVFKAGGYTREGKP